MSRGQAIILKEESSDHAKQPLTKRSIHLAKKPSLSAEEGDKRLEPETKSTSTKRAHQPTEQHPRAE